MTSLFSIEIPRRARACYNKGESFCANDSYISILLPLPQGGYERRDFCDPCWKEVKDECLGETNIYWKSKVPDKKEESQLPKQRNARALILLKRAIQQEDMDSKEEAFVLALLLARSRQMFLRQELAEANLYEVAQTEEMLLVPRLDLSRLQTEAVQQRLAVKFSE